MNNPRILLKTELGNILLELYQAQAPITVANFLRYVDENRFADACFYRVVHMDNQPNNGIKIEVIQGGLKIEDHPHTLPAIAHESTQKTGILHYDGTISMARNEPGTASSEFFICINDQPELNYGGRRNPDGQGFAAFGKVVEGIDIVRKIQSQPVEGQYLIAEIRINATRRP
ncbi:MAG TPA: peptidylprolyl isomerase [Anaerolineales bacterium]|nr:peptidylprolyl isomerase [Anaerolineales bacterium]